MNVAWLYRTTDSKDFIGCYTISIVSIIRSSMFQLRNDLLWCNLCQTHQLTITIIHKKITALRYGSKLRYGTVNLNLIGVSNRLQLYISRLKWGIICSSKLWLIWPLNDFTISNRTIFSSGFIYSVVGSTIYKLTAGLENYLTPVDRL